MQAIELTSELQADAAAAIVARCRRASDELIFGGCTWYPQTARNGQPTKSLASDQIRAWRREFGLPYRTIAAVLAICNLNNTWSGSITMVPAILRAFVNGASTCPSAGLPLACERSWAILHGAPFTFENIGGRTGFKTWNFFQNLCGNSEFVTIDRHAVRACDVLPKGTQDRVGGYEFVADAYRLAADELGWTPAEVQAVAWVEIRGRIA